MNKLYNKLIDSIDDGENKILYDDIRSTLFPFLLTHVEKREFQIIRDYFDDLEAEIEQIIDDNDYYEYLKMYGSIENLIDDFLGNEHLNYYKKHMDYFLELSDNNWHL